MPIKSPGTVQSYIGRCNDYHLKDLRQIILQGFNHLGGMKDIFPMIYQPGTVKILLKPNLLKGAEWNKAVTTHPLILEAILEVFKEFSNIRFTIADSPGIGSCNQAARKSGYHYLTTRYPVDISNVDSKFFKFKTWSPA